MNTTNRVQKPHAVIVSYPAQGHINPLIQFGKLLHSTGFRITFVNTEFIHKRLIETKGSAFTYGLSDFIFETVPDGFAPDDTESRSHAQLVCASTRENSLLPFKELLIKLNSDDNVPPVTCVISDAVLTFPLNAAQELGIPEAEFWTASACGLMGSYHYDEFVKRGLIPLKDESCRTNGHIETPLEWIPGMKGMRLKDMPSFCLTTDPNDRMIEITIDQMKTCQRSSAMIINTIYEFEEDVLKALASYFPPIYTIGPLTQLTSNLLPNAQIYDSLELNLWKEDAECLSWLDKRETKSVVYVNFGSIAIISEEELNEFAIALENCGFNFLWVLRSNMVKGLNESKLAEKGFVERTKERGLILSWCPQEKVLNHKSVGLFVSHAGWNSMLETVVRGVPMICWAFGAEQPTNSRQVCLAWKNGMAIEKNVKGNELSELIKEMMVGEINGKEKRENALKWKKIAEQATSEGGSSSLGFHKLIDEVLLH